MPSSIQISSPARRSRRYSGCVIDARSAVPSTGCAHRVNGRPGSRSTRAPPPAPNVPSRIFGPCKSCRIATGRPQRASPSRMRRTTSACSSCVPWEKLRRATSRPAATRRSSSSVLLLAGPIVQTILVRRIRQEPASSGLKNCPVYERSARRASSSGVPVATTRPPSSPPSGPRSITQSAVFTTSRLCSMITTVLP